MDERLFAFDGGAVGPWRVERLEAFRGETLPAASRLRVSQGPLEAPAPAPGWRLLGVRSHERYVTRAEKNVLVARSPALGRAECTCAALIPVKKSEAWWSLAQDERRALVEESSGHIRIGLEYLPAVARRLYHSRDLGEPFDFLTWFEYAPEAARRFEELVARLRATEEWRSVEREVDVRLVRDAASR